MSLYGGKGKKALTDKKIGITQKLDFLPERVENNLRKGENAGYQQKLNFPFPK